MEQWNAKYRQREDQLRKANDFRNKAVSDTLKQHEEALADAEGEESSGGAGVLAAEKALIESSFSLTQYFERIMNETAQERNAAQADNTKLKSKVDKYTKDYNLVKELRNQYRELETQKISLESTLRAAEEENRNLKQLMGGENNGTSSSRGPGDGNVFGGDNAAGGGGSDTDMFYGGGVGPAGSGYKPRRGVSARRPVWRSNTFN